MTFNQIWHGARPNQKGTFEVLWKHNGKCGWVGVFLENLILTSDIEDKKKTRATYLEGGTWGRGERLGRDNKGIGDCGDL